MFAPYCICFLRGEGKPRGKNGSASREGAERAGQLKKEAPQADTLSNAASGRVGVVHRKKLADTQQIRKSLSRSLWSLSRSLFDELV